MGRYLSQTGLGRLASQETLRGQRLWTVHSSAGDGSCTDCGRPYPCPAALQGAWLIVYWGPYVPDSPLIRPYVVG